MTLLAWLAWVSVSWGGCPTTLPEVVALDAKSSLDCPTWDRDAVASTIALCQRALPGESYAWQAGLVARFDELASPWVGQAHDATVVLLKASAGRWEGDALFAVGLRPEALGGYTVDGVCPRAVPICAVEAAPGSDPAAWELREANLRLKEQLMIGSCTGVRVDERHILTAAHCRSQLGRDPVAVFDFDTAGPVRQTCAGGDPSICGSTGGGISELEFSQATRLWWDDSVGAAGADLALLVMERDPSPGTTLSGDRWENPRKGDMLWTIGHPLGGQSLVSFAGPWRAEPDQGQPVARVDAFMGSSGSAVLGCWDGAPVGLLVQGDVDFDCALDCARPRDLRDGSGFGELMVSAREVRDLLSQLEERQP